MQNDESLHSPIECDSLLHQRDAMKFLKRSLSSPLTILLAASLLLVSCGTRPAATTTDGKLKVSATTSIVADVVAQVGGADIALSTLLPVGTDPHDYAPRPQDAASLANADIVFANGAGLESFLQPLLESAGAQDKLVEVSQGITLLSFDFQGAKSNTQPGYDPHTWMDPNNVILWTQNIAAALGHADPAHAAGYQSRAEAYSASLRDLDAWIRTQVTQVPPEKRLLVMDHAVLGYFAAQYGFIQVGTLNGSFSSEAAPSARELAALEDTIRKDGIHAFFLSEAANQTLAEQLAADTGIRVVWIYHATLTSSSGPAPTYLDFMRYNVAAITDALK